MANIQDFSSNSNEAGHDQIFSLVHSVRLVLAPGAAGIDSLPDCVADLAAVSHCWHRRGRGVGVALGNCDAARAALPRPAAFMIQSPLNNLNLDLIAASP